jgi:PilX N-terminal
MSPAMQTSTTTVRMRLGDERGAALIIALMSMMLLTALAAAVVMVTNTETLISANHRNSQEALYAADAAVERIVQDLLMTPRWNDVLAGSVQSSFIDGSMTSTKTLPSGGSMLLATATDQLQNDTDALNLWGANNPQWKLFAWGPLSDILSNSQIDSNIYVAVWVADDPADSVDGVTPDGNPLADSNGVLTLHAEALGAGGTRKVVEVTVARTSSTEIERGQIAQRGQEELNQRARKAAVQTPGKAITNTRMTVQ